MPESEITIQSLIRVLTHRWHWVLGCAVLVFVCVFLFTLLAMDNQYEATVQLLVSKSKVGDKIQPVDFTMHDLDTYAHLIQSRDILSKALTELKLDQPPFEYKLKDLEGMVDVTPIRNSDILEIRVTMSDPAAAKDLANFLADQAIHLNFELLAGESRQSRQLFQVEVDEAHRQLKQASKALSDFMANAQTSTSGHYLLSSQEALWKLKQDRAFNVALRDENKGKIESLLKILETEAPTRMLKRGISEERDLLDLARKNDSEASLEDLLGLRIDVEHVNYAYDKARAELIDASKTYFGAIKHVEAMTAEIAEIDQEIRQAEREMADKKRLENELEIAANNFREISAKNAEAKTTIASERQDLVIVETAVLPEIPAGPRRLVIAVSAAIFAFFIALVLSLLVDMYAAVERRSSSGI